MTRDANIPLFLWIATAALFHLTSYKGADKVATVIEEKLDVQRFADSIRRRVHASRQPLEIALLEELPQELAPVDRPVPDEDEADEAAEPAERTSQTATAPRKPEKRKEASKDLDAPEQESAPAAEPPKAAEKPKEPEPKNEMPKEDLPNVAVPNRVAVVQHVEDQNQKDNPNAEFIGDTANRVKEQTQARLTAVDQNDPKPTPGSAPAGPSQEAGNAVTSDVAHSEDSPGAMDRAPNERAAGAKVEASVEHRQGGKGAVIREVAPDSRTGREAGSEKGARKAPDDQKAQAEQEARSGSREALHAPEVMTAPGGADSMSAPETGRRAESARRAQQKVLPPRRGRPDALDFLGLGASGTTPGGINLNLTQGAALAAVGRDQLGKERAADGERRRSKHRGSWKTPGLERWRASIENYNASVKPGNQTALNTARVPFAGYLNQIHNRLHPIFADSFLASLDGLPGNHPLSNLAMRTNLEIVLDRDEGKVVKMGITRSSGSTTFDVAALESVQNAAPFGKPPPVIVSPDGNVYLHWEFYRNPYHVCSTYFARPYLLKVSPETAPPRLPPPPSPPFGPREQPLPAQGDLGLLEPPSAAGMLGLAP